MNDEVVVDVTAALTDSEVGRPFVSSVFGTTYLLVWCVAWYPQLIKNYRQRSAEGYSYDLVCFNVYGFILFGFFVTAVEWHEHQFGLTSAVENNDIVFCFHSLIINMAYMAQAWYYDGRLPFSYIGPFCRYFIFVSLFFLLIQIVLGVCQIMPLVSIPGAVRADATVEADWSAAGYAGLVKALITAVKYSVQVVQNYDRRSVKGMSRLGFVMDFGGSFFCVMEIVSDVVGGHSLVYLTGNLPKFFVALMSFFWDGVILIQALLFGEGTPVETHLRVSARKPDSWTAWLCHVFRPGRSHKEQLELIEHGIGFDDFSPIELATIPSAGRRDECIADVS